MTFLEGFLLPNFKIKVQFKNTIITFRRFFYFFVILRH
uniref:Uncharacterized protein n=1 Tax=Anguilla anguilla TaxID=7936 RepID=A0A0E9TTG8_ANGAN